MKSMKMKMKILSFCLIFTAILFSCKKDPLVIANNESTLLSQLVIDNQPAFQYKYNGAKLISEEDSKYNLVLHQYNDNNQLVSTDFYANYEILSIDPAVSDAAMKREEWVTPVQSYKSGNIKYEYNGNAQLTKMIYTPISGSVQYSEFKYDTDNRINKQILFWESNQTGYIDYTYDADGNLIKEELYTATTGGTGVLCSTTTYEFDQKLNPFRSSSRLMTPGISTNINNIIRETCAIHVPAGKGSDVVEVTQTSYKYNANGYPSNKNGNMQYIYV